MLLLSCNSKTKDSEVQEKPKSQEQVKVEAKDTHIYKSKLIEEIREEMLKLANTKSIKVGNFENLLFEGKKLLLYKDKWH